MLNVHIDSKPVSDLLSQISKRMTDLTPAMQSIGQEMVSRVSARFETERDPSGQPWAAWAPATVATYPADGNRRILDRYGDMLSSLNFQARDDAVSIGFATFYAAYHEWGTRRMPRRGLLMDDPDAGTLSGPDLEAVTGILRGFLEADF